MDNDAIAVVEGDGAVSQELIAQGFDRVMFTGGTEIGRKVYEGAAPHLTPVTLELGGKSPVIVSADADIDVAAKRIAWIKLMNSGQTCVAPDYVLADAKIRDELVSKIGDAINEVRGRKCRHIAGQAHRQPAAVRPAGRLPGRYQGHRLDRWWHGRVGSADPADRRRRPRSGRAADEGGDLRPDPAGADGPIPRRRNQIRQLAAQAVGGLPVHQDQEHPRTGDQGGAGGRHAGQPPARSR